jgi:hypothetical protein
MTVVEFPTETEKEDFIWLCDCGCQTFFLYQDHTTKCASCGDRSDSAGDWMKPLSDPVESVGNEITTTVGEPTDLIRRRLQEIVMEPEVIVVVVIREIGSVSTNLFKIMDTDEQRDWLSDRMWEAKQLLISANLNA